jgi:tellurite resistance protein TehA-like permease
MTRRFTPAVPRRARMIVAGLAWSGAGLMLLSWAVRWLEATPLVLASVLAVAGIAIAVGAWFALFRRLARTNVARLEAAPRLACIFGFQPIKSYLIMGAMIALGVTLRHSAVPRPELAVVYLAIGGALLLASFSYYNNLIDSFRGAHQ